METTSTILYGKPVAESVYQRIREKFELLNKKGVVPGLAVVLVGDDPASQVYVRKKGQMCEKLGFISKTIKMGSDISEKTLLGVIDELNNNPEYHGILVQLPLPSHMDENEIILSIDPAKDVDCFHPQNVGLMVSGEPHLVPCTPAGIMEILSYYQIQTEGKHAVVLGRSNIVGKPMANLLVQKKKNANATVTVVHSRTNNIRELTLEADIIIAAIGQPEFLKGDMVKPGTVVIDVGINRVDADNEKGYRLVGDVAYEDVSAKAQAITPVPGGVGPMTIAMLMNNTLTAAVKQTGLNV